MNLGTALRKAGVNTKVTKGISLFRDVPIGAVFVTGKVRTHAPKWTQIGCELHRVGPVNQVDILWNKDELLTKVGSLRARHLQWKDAEGWHAYEADNRFRDALPGPNAVCAWVLPPRTGLEKYEPSRWDKSVANLLHSMRT
jgi:hypothetical protein